MQSPGLFYWKIILCGRNALESDKSIAFQRLKKQRKTIQQRFRLFPEPLIVKFSQFPHRAFAVTAAPNEAAKLIKGDAEKWAAYSREQILTKPPVVEFRFEKDDESLRIGFGTYEMYGNQVEKIHDWSGFRFIRFPLFCRTHRRTPFSCKGSRSG